MQRTLTAGTAVVDITPPVGVELSGGAFGPSDGVLHPLTATALCLTDSQTGSLLISCDLLGLHWNYAVELRTEMAGRTGLPLDAIMVACTHTHGGPSTVTLRGWGTANREFLGDLRGKLLGLADSAVRAAEPARAGSASIDCPGVARNRTSYGTKTDDVLAVVSITGSGDRPLAVVVNHACHPVNLHATGLITPDFPHYVRERIGQDLGKGVAVLYLSGACGNLNPANFEFSPTARTDEARHDRDVKARETGHRIADKTLELIPRIEVSADTVLRHTVREIPIPLQPLPPKSEVMEILQQNERAAEAEQDKSQTNWEYLGHVGSAEWARAALEAIEKGESRDNMTLVLQGIRVGQAAVVGMPGELFTEFGIAIRRSGIVADVLVATKANGGFGYFPSPAAYERGTYEAVVVPRHLGLQAFAPDVGSRVGDGCLEVLRRLAD